MALQGLPPVQGPNMVGPQGVLSAPLVRVIQQLWAEVQRLNGDIVDVAETANAASPASEHSGDELLAAMYGTRGIDIFGSVASGVEIRGPEITQGNQGIPGRDGEDAPDAWPIPGPKGDKGDPGQSVRGMDGEDAGESWPMPAFLTPYPHPSLVCRSLTIGTKTIPAGMSLYVAGPYEISAGATVEVEADAVLEIG